MRSGAFVPALLLVGCSTTSGLPQAAAPLPPTGVRLVLEGPVEAAPGHHLVMGDLSLAAGAQVPRHVHSGEEFLYVVEGSVTVQRDGLAELALRQGEGLRIAPGVPHSAVAGEAGLRAVTSWIVADGRPLREPAPDQAPGSLPGAPGPLF